MESTLRQGQAVKLFHPNGKPLAHVNVSFGWKHKLFSSDVDLDASCIGLDANGNVIFTIWFDNTYTEQESVRHGGDNLTGEGEGESIFVKLVSVFNEFPNLAAMYFVVTSYNRKKLNKLKFINCSLLDYTGEENGQSLGGYKLSKPKPDCACTAAIVARIIMGNTWWQAETIGQYATGRVVDDLKNAVIEHFKARPVIA